MLLIERKGLYQRGRASHRDAGLSERGGPLRERHGPSQRGRASQIKAGPLKERQGIATLNRPGVGLFYNHLRY